MIEISRKTREVLMMFARALVDPRSARVQIPRPQRLLGRLAGGIAHGFDDLLTVIIG
jgi:hypothetical protein